MVNTFVFKLYIMKKYQLMTIIWHIHYYKYWKLTGKKALKIQDHQLRRLYSSYLSVKRNEGKHITHEFDYLCTFMRKHIQSISDNFTIYTYFLLWYYKFKHRDKTALKKVHCLCYFPKNALVNWLKTLDIITKI